MQLKQSGGILHLKVVAQDEHLSGVVVSKAKKRSPSQAIQMEKERWIDALFAHARSLSKDTLMFSLGIMMGMIVFLNNVKYHLKDKDRRGMVFNH